MNKKLRLITTAFILLISLAACSILPAGPGAVLPTFPAATAYHAEDGPAPTSTSEVGESSTATSAPSPTLAATRIPTVIAFPVTTVPGSRSEQFDENLGQTIANRNFSAMRSAMRNPLYN